MLPEQSIVKEVGERRVLDRDLLQELQDELDCDLQPILEAFLGKLASRIAAIHEAVAKNDPELLGRAAHTLKGTGRQLGVMLLADLMEQLETLGRAGKMGSEVEALMPRLEMEVSKAREAILAEIGREDLPVGEITPVNKEK